jgi:rubrerythrin
MSEKIDTTDTGALGAALAAIDDVADLLAYAYVMEAEAADRYAELADQMAMHNNDEVAEIFGKLAKIERLHAEEIVRRTGAAGPPHRSPWEYHWLDPESPEVTPLDEVHYLMTAHHALKVALHNELRAQAFYEAVRRVTPSEEVRELATEFAGEEREHVALVEAWLEKYPEPPADWDLDTDPVANQ